MSNVVRAFAYVLIMAVICGAVVAVIGYIVLVLLWVAEELLTMFLILGCWVYGWCSDLVDWAKERMRRHDN